MSRSRFPTDTNRDAAQARRDSASVHAARRATAPARILPLPSYDVRVRRELAHRRFVFSIVRQVVRVASLHALDAIMVASAVFASAWLTDTPQASGALPALIAFVLAGLNVRGSYRSGVARRDAVRVLTGVLIGVFLAWLPSTLRVADLPLSFLAAFGLSTMVLVVLERRAVNAVVHQAYLRGFGLRRALIISEPEDVESIMSGIAGPGEAAGGEPDDQEVVGFITPGSLPHPRALGTMAQLPEVLEDRDVGELLVAASLPPEQLASVAELCFGRGVRVLVLPRAAHSFQGWSELTRVGRWPAYQLHPARLELPELALKRASDLVLASIGLLLAAPAMVLIALAIRIESRGPVFFRQRRVGLGGREFMMWKFRSMLVEAEAKQAEIAHLNHYGNTRLFKMREDPRITRVGRFLRRFSMDELPQLFNVLAGDMALVGPRPPLPSEVRSYESRHFVRLSVVPGLTGPWQVNGRNLITDFEEVVRLERDYIEHWSLRSDLEIMIRTLGVVISGKGAY